MTDGAATIEQIRQHFPALERQCYGQPVAYFDAPGGTQVPRQVVEAMVDYLYRHNANSGWSYPSSQETDGHIAAAREAVACLLKATPSEIVFGPNMTSLTYRLAEVVGRGYESDAEILVNELEHHANVDPRLELGRRTGAKVRVVKMDPVSGQIDWQDFERLCNRRTCLIAIGAASNALGTINDVARASQLARAVGAHLFVDAVHFAAHELIDVQAMGCDFLVCSAYKLYGPHMGALFVRAELLSSLEFPRLAPAPDCAPDRAETGTRNHEGLAGVTAAVDFLASCGSGEGRRQRLEGFFGRLHATGDEMTRQLWEGLSDIPGVRVFGPPPEAPRTPTISFAVDRLGLSESGLVRAGCACYTTPGEVERLVDSVRRVAG